MRIAFPFLMGSIAMIFVISGILAVFSRGVLLMTDHPRGSLDDLSTQEHKD